MAIVRFDPVRDLDPYIFFSGRICHDLNNMITSANGALSLFEFKVDQAPPGLFDEDMARLQRAIDQFGDFTRKLEQLFLRTGSGAKIPFDLNTIVQMAVKKQASDAHDIQIQATSSFGEFDVELVMDAISAGLKNAVEAMKEGGEIRVKLGQSEQGGNTFHVLEIRDNGNGLTAAEMKRIFEPFRSLQKRGNLLGLGFCTIGAAIKEHRGFMEFESEPGQGSTLRLGFLQS